MKDILKNKLKYLINKKKTLLEIYETLELKDYEVIGLVELETFGKKLIRRR
jgi:hypothetical protein